VSLKALAGAIQKSRRSILKSLSALFAALFVSRKLESTIYPNPDPDVLVSSLKSSAIIYIISVSPSLILKHEIFLLRLIRLSKNA
jgi:hypothetical protein